MSCRPPVVAVRARMRRQFDGPVDAETALSLVETAPPHFAWNSFHAQVIPPGVYTFLS